MRRARESMTGLAAREGSSIRVGTARNARTAAVREPLPEPDGSLASAPAP